ncbi:MAG: hypothetical protein SV062_14000 [Thermodesulfobacteriota bacterium]|nr:hypothetical protein [Thermodesulfobacteriota bacterium]
MVEDLSRPYQIVTEVIYEIQASKDVKLSNIGRILKEKICFLSSKRIHDKIILSLDIGDIRKYYAKATKNLAKVRDGSKKK